jgi:ribosomal peptide maturation radical SAM protein 1
MRVLLVELPFKTHSRPSLGLSLLKASLDAGGHACTIRYANVEFAARIGLEIYETIAEKVPEPLLVGDFVFAPAVSPARGRFEALRAAGSLSLEDGSRIGRAPDWLWDMLPGLQETAVRFAAECAAAIARTDFDVVGFSCMFQTLPSLAVARELKARAKEKWIVFGGSHCEGDMGAALHEAYPFIDFVCRGEGERLVVDLVDELASDAPAFSRVKGLVWRDGGGASAMHADGAERIDDVNGLPRPRYDDWMEQLSAHAPQLHPEDLEMPFETSRGCWYGAKRHCTFCGLNGQTMTFRSKAPDRVIDELRELQRYGVPFIYTVDNIFDHRYFETLLPRLAREPFDHTIFYETKANLTRAQVAALADARIRMIQPGIETLSTPVLELMRKGVSAYQNVRLLKWAAEMGVGVTWTLLYGFPGEKPEDYRAMAEVLPSLSHLVPPQGVYKVRVDRFSPLHFDSDALGVGATRPVSAYGMVHDVPDAMIRRLAYHFEPANDTRSFDYAQPVADAVRDWRAAVGASSLVSITRGERLLLLDARPAARRSAACLEGAERAVYLACDAGASLEAVAQKTGISTAEARRVLGALLEDRFVVHLDGRFLGVAVSFDAAVPVTLPESVLPSLAHGLYRKRIATLSPMASLGGAGSSDAAVAE